MKKLVFYLLMFISLSVFAQERTVSKLIGNGTYYKYTGLPGDTLIATNQDTIDYVFEYQGPDWVKKVAVKIRYDSIAGADTTVSASLFGKEFSDDATYVSIIAAAASGAVTTSNVIHIITSDYTETTASYATTGAAFTIKQDTATFKYYPADSLKVPATTFTNAAQTLTPLDKSYRFYRLRLIISGDDLSATNAGIKVDEIEIKLYTN